MNLLHFYTTLYGYTHRYKSIPIWALTPARRIIRTIANNRLKRYFDKKPICLSSNQDKDVIVSLTSFPARIDYVYMAIESPS